ncbi:TIGR03862 family flavoprotein [Alphaproteobacteria bacterium]|nr:TIGR03862 family flavoprotein [Alphaproteobacteria bacterium]
MKTKVAIIGGGPTGLMAAYILSRKNFNVTIYDRKPTLGRKFLLAGRGGLNITHSECNEDFLEKYGKTANIFKLMLENFSQKNLMEFCEMLGEKTFIGSSGRVFPKSFKASPLLRSWLYTLKNQDVTMKTNHDWIGWDDNKLIFKTETKNIIVDPNITLLALGGLSWPKLGSDGSWIEILEKDNIKISKIQPTNCGFFVKWSNVFKNRFAGYPLKSVELSFKDKKIKGEFIITKEGIEGGLIYSISSILRENINEIGYAEIIIDLKPDFSIKKIRRLLLKPRLKLSTTNYLRKTLNLSEVAIGLLMEFKNKEGKNNQQINNLAHIIKNYKIILDRPFSIDRCISTAGGISFKSINKDFMLINTPNTYVAGEMLDWEAPTGGYLLQACISNGAFVANNIIKKIGKIK